MKLIVSVMPRSLEEAQELDATRYEDADIIEWRADFLTKDTILQVAPAIFEKFAGRELVFTLRTRAEGGEIELSSEEYVQIIKEVTQLYQPDYVDFEYFSYKDVFEEMLDFPNLVLSYHNFQETPENMMEILSELTSLSPKVVKVSVMAHTEQDVLDLMNYTRGFKTLNPEQEYVTISMGKMGKVSRITSDVTGSSWSFASLDEASAPGQISLSNMKKIREILESVFKRSVHNIMEQLSHYDVKTDIYLVWVHLFRAAKKEAKVIQLALDYHLEKIFVQAMQEFLEKYHGKSKGVSSYLHSFWSSAIVSVLLKWIKDGMKVPAEKIADLRLPFFKK